MIKKYLRKIMSKYGPWRITQTLLAALIVVMTVTLLILLLVPVRMLAAERGIDDSVAAARDDSIKEEDSVDVAKLVSSMRTGLFKSAIALQGKPMADKTVERIKSQLKLQCIMPIGGEPAAYIEIKGEGLRKCRIGDVCNSFTVLDIREKSVDISIVGHKVTLRR